MEKYFKFMPYEKQKEKAKRNRIFLRKGYCSRCGMCCWSFKGRPSMETRLEPCKYLEFNDDGIASCVIYERRHESCKDFPLVKFSAYDIKYFKDCTYKWELDISLTQEEALKRHKRTCDACVNKEKEKCENRTKTTKLIKEKLT